MSIDVAAVAVEYVPDPQSVHSEAPAAQARSQTSRLSCGFEIQKHARACVRPLLLTIVPRECVCVCVCVFVCVSFHIVLYHYEYNTAYAYAYGMNNA